MKNSILKKYSDIILTKAFIVIINNYQKMFYICIILYIASNIFISYNYFSAYKGVIDLIRGLALALITAIIAARIIKDIESISDTKQQILNSVSDIKTQVIASISTCTGGNAINALKLANGLVKVNGSESNSKEGIISDYYRCRKEATEDITKSLNNAKNIDIIGISLTGPIDDNNRTTLDLIKEYIHQYNRDEIINFRILVIDPDARGACLRRRAEVKNNRQDLDHQVNTTIKDLYALKIYNKNEKIKIDLKIYKSAPIMFLFKTDTTAFVQYYFFHKDFENFVLKYESDKNEQMMKELDNHFNALWGKDKEGNLILDEKGNPLEDASTGIEEYQARYSRGFDKAISDSGIINMYYGSKEIITNRMDVLIKSTNRLWIKGITLNSFFKEENQNSIYHSIKKFIGPENKNRQNVDFKILILNRISKQALYRSYKEYKSYESRNKKFDNFKDFKDYFLNQEVKNMADVPSFKLIYDSAKSEGVIKTLVEQNSAEVNIEAKRYNSATDCFIFMTDESVIVEQYTYGISEKHAPKLGAEIPLIEYKKGSAIYDLYEDHFNHIFNNDEYSSSFIEKNEENGKYTIIDPVSDIDNISEEHLKKDEEALIN